MEIGHALILKDLLTSYDLQIAAMKTARLEGKNITASLHERLARHLLETYFDLVEKALE